MVKPLESLIPSIEQREGAWIQVRERLAKNVPSALRTTLTLSREFGCEAYPLAESLQKALEKSTQEPWIIYDRALVEKVASDEHISRHLLEHLGDESQKADVLKREFGFPTHDEAFAQMAKYVLQIAKMGNAILVGRGAAVVCQDMTNCLHIRLEARLDWRVANMARRLEMPLEEAQKLVEKQSCMREQFISQCLHCDITKAHWYDAILNNERLNVDQMSAVILSLAQSKWGHQPPFK